MSAACKMEGERVGEIVSSTANKGRPSWTSNMCCIPLIGFCTAI